MEIRIDRGSAQQITQENSGAYKPANGEFSKALQEHLPLHNTRHDKFILKFPGVYVPPLQFFADLW